MQITVAMAHLAGRTAPVEQLCHGSQPALPFLENAVDLLGAETGVARGCETAILELGKIGHLRRAAVVKTPLRGSVEPGNMIGELIHRVPIEVARLGKRIEEQGLIEPPHHDDPIESLAMRRKADSAVCAAEKAANLLVKRRRGALVQDQLGLASAPPQIRGRKVEIGVGYCALQLEDAVARDENQRSVRFDNLDAIRSRTVGGRVLQKGDDVPLIFAQERFYKV